MDFTNNEEENFDMSPEMNILSNFQQEWGRQKRYCYVVLLCYIVHALHLLQMMSRYTHVPVKEVNDERERRRLELMKQLVETGKCRHIIRMGPEAFMLLCHKLRGTGIVKDTLRSTVEEQVAKFLHIIGHNVKNRSVSFFFHRSRETVSRHFHNVLRAIVSLEDEFLVQPSGIEVPSQILNSGRFFPFFKELGTDVNLYALVFGESVLKNAARMLLRSLIIIGAILGLLLGIVGTAVPWLFPYIFTPDHLVIQEVYFEHHNWK